MCISMVDIQSVAAEIRRGKKKKIEEEEDRKKLQGKNIMAPLLHRAAIIRLVPRSTSDSTCTSAAQQKEALSCASAVHDDRQQ